MKNCILIIFVTFNILIYSQNSDSKSDDFYYNVENIEFNKIKDIYINGFNFSNPTLNLENLIYIFQPKTNEFIPNNNKKIRKISTYIKFSKSSEKRLLSYILFDEIGRKIMSNEEGYINNYFTYDSNNRIISKTRIVRNDTVSYRTYKYNEKNQLLELSSDSKIEYDEKNRPIEVFNSKVKDSPYKTVLKYDNNKVRIEEMNGDKVIAFKIFTYSSNYNLIKEEYNDLTIFNTYDPKNQKIKSVTFNKGKLYQMQKFEYNKFGDIISHRFLFSIDIKNGTKAENIIKYKYDRFGNKIYENSSGDITKSTTERFYEIEYYY